MTTTEITSRPYQAELGRKIVAYWLRRGHEVHAFVEAIPAKEAKLTGVGGWRLVTDLVNGLPPALLADRRSHAHKVRAA